MTQSIHELYYFDKFDNLESIEKYINEIRKLGEDKSINKNKRVKLLSKIITALYKQFNFDPEYSSIDLKFTKNFICEIRYNFLNGMPIEVNELIDMDKKNKRFKFKSKYAPSISISLSTSVLFDKDMTPAMIVAALLHEIGHSFEWRLRMVFYEIENIESILEFLKKINIFNLTDNQLETIASIFNDFFSPKNAHSLEGDNYADWQEAESFCDQFAAMHGYSEELVSFLSVCEKNNIKWYNSHFSEKNDTSKIHELLCDILFYLSHIFDMRTHPEYGERMRLITVALKAELKNNKSLSLKEKKILQKKIENIDKKVKEVLKQKDTDSYETSQSKLWDIKVYNKPMSYKDLKTRGLDYMFNNYDKIKSL